ncbi:class Ib ribonucleoside-diphosphate reductase assembly flavoprotein NrdI [uncultured Vagococcus sp.]|uniref:class Ib ribonucleoside-diphosphate reductase assembly flavoprotein NrdI n=1 Tax=uncultured Vagococcus sp. TaxID=189676 RepID=UPI0037DCA49C
MTIRILFFSVSGNTRAFVKKLQAYGEVQRTLSQEMPLIELKEITDQSHFEDEAEPFVAFVPTYLDGGNGLDNGTTEIMTNTLGEYIEYHANRSMCLGVVGSGNKNFNWQYCLTAKQYAEKFNFPFLADYELRGTPTDVETIYGILQDLVKKYA